MASAPPGVRFGFFRAARARTVPCSLSARLSRAQQTEHGFGRRPGVVGGNGMSGGTAMRGLEGRTYIVTGAASGIGLATASRLLDEGASVMGADLADEPAAAPGRVAAGAR